MFKPLLWLTRYSIYIAIVGSWLAALVALILGGYEVFVTVLTIFNGISEKGSKLLVLNLVEAVDMFLLGTVFYLIALGLYELFINENASVPSWLVINDLDDLKGKLVKVMVVVLAVQFLAQVLGWTGQVELLAYGAAIALVIAALTYFLSLKPKKIAE